MTTTTPPPGGELLLRLLECATLQHDVAARTIARRLELEVAAGYTATTWALEAGLVLQGDLIADGLRLELTDAGRAWLQANPAPEGGG